MTRFARSRGSKASNERVAEEATSWQEMKNQIELKLKDQEITKKREEFNFIRQKNYNSFVETIQNEKANTIWADFPNITKSKAVKRKQTKNEAIENVERPKTKKYKKAGIATSGYSSSNVIDTRGLSKKNVMAHEEIYVKNEKKGDIKLGAKVHVKKEKGGDIKVDTNKNGSGKEFSQEICATIIKKKPKKSNQKKNKPSKQQNPVVPKLDTKVSLDIKKISVKPNKKNCRKLPEEEIKKQSGKDHDICHKKMIKKKERKCQENSTNIVSTGPVVTTKQKLTRREKIERKLQYKRRKPEFERPQNILILNGEKIELVMFSGYPIRKDDAERLTELKKQMISKGIPRNEVERTLKLERRKCEKSLARLKKNVCFNCRKSGHNLSDCPELENNQAASTGICFKCGSTEHTHFDCKVVRNETDFKFAQCFICKEQGHIARQCPENPRGLYPKGGACKLCGDVTHFKKDCPTLQLEHEDKNIISLGVIDEDTALEGLGDEQFKPKGVIKQQKVKKIKF